MWQYIGTWFLPVVDGPVVYFLCCGDEVMYVGESTSLRRRLLQHLGGKPPFDNVKYVAAPKNHSKRLALETKYIQEYKPPWNVVMTSSWIAVLRERFASGELQNVPHTR